MGEHRHGIAQVCKALFHGERAGTAAAAIVKRIRADRGPGGDPLLVFVYEARNSPEKGLGDRLATIGADCRPATPNDPPPMAIPIAFLQVDENGVKREIKVKRGQDVVLHNFRPILQPFTVSRGTFAVPTEHLGTQIDDPTPVNIGRMALAYYEARHREIEDAMVRR